MICIYKSRLAVHNSKFVNLKHVVVYYEYKSIVRINDATHTIRHKNHLEIILSKQLRLFLFRKKQIIQNLCLRVRLLLLLVLRIIEKLILLYFICFPKKIFTRGTLVFLIYCSKIYFLLS